MATLTLTALWINRLDSGAAITAQSGQRRGQSYDVDGEIKTFAGGRQRSITTAGERGQFPFTLLSISATTVDTLRSWLGLAVQVRDHRGQRWYGAILSVVVAERPEPTLYDATVALRMVTTPDGV